MPRRTQRARPARRVGHRASMRPGRNAPENGAGDDGADAGDRASMRPGRNAPENAARLRLFASPRRGFNEAGAKCPGEEGILAMPRRAGARFNEAGAKCPGERRPRRKSSSWRRRASMRPGRNAPENADRLGQAAFRMSGLQ